MMRARTTARALSPVKEKTFVSAGKLASQNVGSSPVTEDVKWEVRPCGMLVQKRSPDSAAGPPAPTIRVRVKYGSAHHEIYLSSQATFGERQDDDKYFPDNLPHLKLAGVDGGGDGAGELKKLLSERTGLHPQDQKLLYKDKEKESAAYLDISGVKDRSKIVLVEDSAGQARRFLEMRKNAKTEKAAKSLIQISIDVDKLANKVSALESIASKGKKVAEVDVVGLIELLMNQLLKLDGLAVEGDAKLRRRTQVQRVQKYVEILDALKIKNSAGGAKVEMQQQQPPPAQQQRGASQPPAAAAANWETLDLLSGPPQPAAPPPPRAAVGAAAAAVSPAPRLDWELF